MVSYLQISYQSILVIYIKYFIKLEQILNIIKLFYIFYIIFCMLKKLKLEIKDVTEKFRSNRKYTSVERVKEVEKIVLTEIHNKDLD